MAGGLGDFVIDLTKFSKKINVDYALMRKKITIDLHSAIVKRTPVDTGRLKNSWAVSDDLPSDWVPPEGNQTGEGVVEATFSNPFTVSWIVTNLPYVWPIEFDGHSSQAPAGMVRISLAELQADIISRGG